ncbi:MAG: hypothetical protein IT338_20220 [Thermomicrobiales bacterium]|nr:hypothetical protein [Thermomicrobiales bacterium]
MSRKRRIVLVGIVVAAAAIGLLAVGHLVFSRLVAREVGRLLGQSANRQGRVIAERDLAGLPEPVARWLRAASVVGQEIPRIVHLQQEGRIRLGPDAPWLPFTARQVYTTDPPGFVWAAEGAVAPFVSVRVLDRYIAGRGGTEPRLLGLIPLGRASGPEIDAASLQRYLNEIMWFPAAALSPGVQWEAIDAHSARATIHDHDQRVSGIFVWDDAGQLVTMTADRYRTVDGRYLLTPWETPIRDYGAFSGVRVPIAGEGAWHLEAGDFTYIALRVTSLTYDFPPNQS